jgi:hypothetical protein
MAWRRVREVVLSHLFGRAAECSHFRRGNNYGVECVRTPRQRPHLDSRRGRSEPYSGRAFCLVDRTASASTL